MVNIEEFAARIKKIISYYQLSAASFADVIGVQRSSISHILSGRNKPSLDFVMKVLEKYPEVELYWLLNGKGEFPKESNPTKAVENEQKTTDVQSAMKFPSSEKKEISPPKSGQEPQVTETGTSSKIERIVIFYKDGSFKDYTQ